jgi:hypothetical protein
MWIDINQGYINENTIEYLEKINEGNKTSLRFHLISGRVVEIEGELARRILEYAVTNKVFFMDTIFSPIGQNEIQL